MVPWRDCLRTFRGQTFSSDNYMKHEVHTMSDEPVGIVISRGWEPEPAPRFSAYVWAPWPDEDLEPEVVVT